MVTTDLWNLPNPAGNLPEPSSPQFCMKRRQRTWPSRWRAGDMMHRLRINSRYVTTLLLTILTAHAMKYRNLLFWLPMLLAAYSGNTILHSKAHQVITWRWQQRNAVFTRSCLTQCAPCPFTSLFNSHFPCVPCLAHSPSRKSDDRKQAMTSTILLLLFFLNLIVVLGLMAIQEMLDDRYSPHYENGDYD